MSERALTSVEALLEKDADDESLRRYKEQLLGSAAHGDRGGTTCIDIAWRFVVADLRSFRFAILYRYER